MMLICKKGGCVWYARTVNNYLFLFSKYGKMTWQLRKCCVPVNKNPLVTEQATILIFFCTNTLWRRREVINMTGYPRLRSGDRFQQRKNKSDRRQFENICVTKVAILKEFTAIQPCFPWGRQSFVYGIGSKSDRTKIHKIPIGSKN
jgi:hypothetical protein